MTAPGKEKHDPFTPAVLGFLVPGGGHLYTRRYAKAVYFFVLVAGTFLAGQVLSDFRAVSIDHRPYWFLGQVFAGIPAFLSLLASPSLQTLEGSSGLEAGVLYTTVAGLLNVLVLLDASFPTRQRLLINVDDAQAEDADALFRALRESEDAVVRGVYPSLGEAVQALQSLSFVEKTARGSLSLPAALHAGAFKTASRGILVMGGRWSAEQREEAEASVKSGARRWTLASGDEETRGRKPFWRR